MGDFHRIAERILRRLEETHEEIFRNENDGRISSRGVSVEDIRNEVRDSISHEIGFHDEINFYPGIPGASCCELAIFVSLNSPIYTKGQKHLKCKEAMEKIVQHMQGGCAHRTKTVVFITDSWDETAFAKWKANLEQISYNSHFEIYLIAGRSPVEIRL